jgi:selenium metabolism protein YedF
VEKRVDARGLACPLPVINTKKILDQLDSGKVTTIVDNPVARDNLLRLAQSSGYTALVEEAEGEFTVTMVKGSPEEVQTSVIQLGAVSPLPRGEQVVVVSSSTLGRGDEELGRVLMRSFLFTLSEADQCPDCLIFMNSGVKLATQGSELIEFLQVLSAKGCEILSCGTCLDFFKLKDQLVVGKISNMYELVERMQGAQKLINF